MRPMPRSLATVRIWASGVAVERVVAEGVRRDQPRVVVGHRQQVARRQVAGLDPLAVGHPLGAMIASGAGDQHDLVDRDGLLPRRPGHGHRPAPAEVARLAALEEVGGHPVALGLGAEVLADVVGVDLGQQRLAGRVDGRRGPTASALRASRRPAWSHRRQSCQIGRLDRRGRLSTACGPRGRWTGRDVGPSASRALRQDGAMSTPGESERRVAAGTPSARGRRSTGRGLRLGGARRPAGSAGTPSATARRAAAAEGADSSGLARLIELGALNAAADAAVAISLAGTLFFQVPTGEARGQVSLFLGLTHAAVRDRGAAGRPDARPVRPRPALGDRRHDGRPRLPGAG